MKELDVIYNRYGKPILRFIEKSPGDYRFVDYQGNHIGFFINGKLYNYKGNHIGWFELGIMRDLKGYCAGFGNSPTDLIKPLLPLKQIKPIPGIVKIAPIKPLVGLGNIKPIKSFTWSNFEPVELFLNQQRNG